MGPRDIGSCVSTIDLGQDSPEGGSWQAFNACLRLGKTFLVRIRKEHIGQRWEKEDHRDTGRDPGQQGFLLSRRILRPDSEARARLAQTKCQMQIAAIRSPGPPFARMRQGLNG